MQKRSNILIRNYFDHRNIFGAGMQTLIDYESLFIYGNWLIVFILFKGFVLTGCITKCVRMPCMFCVNEHNGNQKKRIFQIALVFALICVLRTRVVGEGFVKCDVLRARPSSFLVPVRLLV